MGDAAFLFRHSVEGGDSGCADRCFRRFGRARGSPVWGAENGKVPESAGKDRLVHRKKHALSGRWSGSGWGARVGAGCAGVVVGRVEGALFELMFSRSLLLLLALSLGARAADWPEFLGPARDNTSPETGLIEGLGAGGVPVVWSKEIGAGYAAPSVSGGVLVLHHRRGEEEIVQALAAGTGAERWRYAYPSHFVDPFGYNNGPRCSPLLREGRCYTLGAEGRLVCLELLTGALRWERDLAADFAVPEAFFGVGSSPVEEDGLLYVMAGGQPDSGMVALEAATGKTVWQSVGAKTWNGVPMTGWPGERTVRWNVNDPAYAKQASYCAPVLATIHGRRHLLCCMRQGLVSLDPKTGAPNFAFWFRARQDSSVNAMTPVVEGDRILLSSAYYHTGSVLLQVHEDGLGVDEVWRSDALEMHWSRPVLTGGFLYAFSGRNEPDGRFRCVDFRTGALRWDRPEGWPNGGHSKLAEDAAMPEVFGRGSAVLAEGKLFVLGEAGLLGLVHPTPEKPEELGRWQVPGLRYPCWAGPVLAERRLYLRSEERLVCLDLARGQP